MSSKIDRLAERIAILDPSEQAVLLEKIAELNYQHGLEELSQKYRERLEKEGKSNQKADEVMIELEKICDKIASDEY